MSEPGPSGQSPGDHSNQPIPARAAPGLSPVNPYTIEDSKQPGPPPRSNPVLIVLLVGLGLAVPMTCVLAALLLPAVSSAREAARRMTCSNNMKQIGLALHNYHAAYESLPPAYTVDASGRPLHSWRTLILPFMEQQALYEQIDLSKPWDDPANLAIAKTVVPAYACPSTSNDPTYTSYVAVVDPQGVMSGPQPTKFIDVTDGLSYTLLFVECDSELAVPWMAPRDIDRDQFLQTGTATAAGGHLAGAHVAMADGAITFYSDSTDLQVRQALVSKDGGGGESDAAGP